MHLQSVIAAGLALFAAGVHGGACKPRTSHTSSSVETATGSTSSASPTVTATATWTATTSEASTATAIITTSTTEEPTSTSKPTTTKKASTTSKATSTTHKPTPTPKPDPEPTGPLPGLNKAQSKHARTIISRVKANSLPKRACLVAVATAMQESTMRMLANSKVPASLKYPHEGVGHDHDSVGLFQQRGNGAWGSLADRMDAAESANMFLKALKRVDDWEKMSIARAAQKVQVSAFPDAYAKWESLARKVCDAGW